jgi:hypothetical protein
VPQRTPRRAQKPPRDQQPAGPARRVYTKAESARLRQKENTIQHVQILPNHDNLYDAVLTSADTVRSPKQIRSVIRTVLYRYLYSGSTLKVPILYIA